MKLLWVGYTYNVIIFSDYRYESSFSCGEKWWIFLNRNFSEIQKKKKKKKKFPRMFFSWFDILIFFISTLLMASKQ